MCNIRGHISKIREVCNDLANMKINNFLDSKIFYVEEYTLKRPEYIITIQNETYNDCLEYIKSQVHEKEWNGENRMIKDRDGYYATCSKMFRLKFDSKNLEKQI